MPGFSKSERLHLKKDIAELFDQGEKWSAYPFRVVLRVRKKEEVRSQGVALLVSVSKRNFKKATDRNRIKRQIREGYRLNKEVLYSRISDRLSENEPLEVHIGLLYTSKTKEEWPLLEKKIRKALLDIAERIV